MVKTDVNEKNSTQGILLSLQTFGPMDSPFHFFLGVLPGISQVLARGTSELQVPELGSQDLIRWMRYFDPDSRLNFVNPLEYYRESCRRTQLLVRLRGKSPFLVQREQDAYWKLARRDTARRLRILAERGRSLSSPQERYSTSEIVFIFRLPSENEARTKKGMIRTIKNGSEVISAMRNFGLDPLVVDPSQMDPEDVILALSSAKVILGQYGAGLSHQIWMHPGSLVVEITARERNQFTTWVYKHLAKSLGHRYARLQVQDKWNGDIEVSNFIAGLEDAIKNATSPSYFEIKNEAFRSRFLVKKLIGLRRGSGI